MTVHPWTMEMFLDELKLAIELVTHRQCEVSSSFIDPKSSYCKIKSGQSERIESSDVQSWLSLINQFKDRNRTLLKRQVLRDLKLLLPELQP